jgi:tetratricopeptide (TPR) repeat protein
MGVVVVVAGVFAGSVAIKVRLYPARPLYMSDAAMRYRYARMSAMGEPVPATDTRIQTPEGLRVRSLLFLFQDKTAGSAYRLILGFKPDLDFDLYLRWFVCIFSSLPVVCAYLAGSSLWKNRLAGVVSAGLYAVSIPAMERVIGNYLREEFALPFIFMSFFLFIAALHNSHESRRSNLLGFLSGAFMFLSLSAWHLTGFYLLVFLVGAAVAAFTRSNLKPVLRPLLYVVGFAVAAGAVNEPLRAKLFLVSPPMVLGYCLVISYALSVRFRMSRRASAAVLFIMTLASIALFSALSPNRGDYSHVYSLIQAKVRFLLDKPADPRLLAPDARLLWLGPFQSPSLASFLFGFGSVLVFAIYPAVRILRTSTERTSLQGEVLLLYMATAFLALCLFVRRLEVFLIFFLVLLIAGFLKGSGKTRSVVVTCLISVLFLFEAHKAITYPESTPLTRALLRIDRPEVEKPSIHDRDKGEIFRYIESSTPSDAVFLTRFAVGPMVVAYGDRSSVLHPVFETRQMRERVLECASAFYGLEKDLKRVCTKYGVDYVLYEANQLLDNSELGERYLTDNLRLTTNCVAFLMHFAPEWLAYFEPVFQTDYFRVFRVRDEPGNRTAAFLRYSVQFDPAVFTVDKMGAVFSDSLVDEAWRSIRRAFASARKGNELMGEGNYRDAARYYEYALELVPNLGDIRLSLAESLRQMGRLDLAAAVYKEMIELNPYSGPAYLNLASVYREQELLTMAVDLLEEALKHLPNDIPIMQGLAETYEELGDTSSASALRQLIRE